MDSNVFNFGLVYVNFCVVEKVLCSLNEDELYGVFNMMNLINVECYCECLCWGEESVVVYMYM